MRSDMTIPIARVVASRYADAEPPSASATSRMRTGRSSAARASSEFLQGGVELIGVPAPEGGQR